MKLVMKITVRRFKRQQGVYIRAFVKQPLTAEQTRALTTELTNTLKKAVS